MNKGKYPRGRTGGEPSDILAGRFEYDRADEKRKIHDEIEDFLTERQEKKPSQPK